MCIRILPLLESCNKARLHETRSELKPIWNLNRFENSFRLHGNFIMTNFEISDPFKKLFRLHLDFTAATF